MELYQKCFEERRCIIAYESNPPFTICAQVKFYSCKLSRLDFERVLDIIK